MRKFDQALVRRVRSRLERAVSFPQLVDIEAEGGRVILTGCISAEEMGSLMRAVHSVRGVRDVDSQLVATTGIESMPGDTDARALGRGIARSALHTLAVLCGGAIAYGVIRYVRARTEPGVGGPGLEANVEPLSGELRPST